VWDIACSSGGRMRVRVESCTGTSVVCRTSMGKSYVMERSVLATHKRSARLVPEGEVSRSTRPLVGLTLRKQEKRTASEMVRTIAPKGIVTATDQENEMLRLRESGMSLADIGKKVAFSVKVVTNRLKKARDARNDAKIMQAMRDA